jgi:uncharacterized membrane protein YfhO
MNIGARNTNMEDEYLQGKPIAVKGTMLSILPAYFDIDTHGKKNLAYIDIVDTNTSYGIRVDAEDIETLALALNRHHDYEYPQWWI